MPISKRQWKSIVAFLSRDHTPPVLFELCRVINERFDSIADIRCRMSESRRNRSLTQPREIIYACFEGGPEVSTIFPHYRDISEDQEWDYFFNREDNGQYRLRQEFYEACCEDDIFGSSIQDE